MQKIAIPLFGKMSTRSYHNQELTSALASFSLTPQYFLPKNQIPAQGGPYQELHSKAFEQYLKQHRLVQTLMTFRRFTIDTETADLRLRETLGQYLDSRVSVAATNFFGLAISALRKLPQIAPLSLAVENSLNRTNFYRDQFKESGISAILTPGIGGYAFWHEGQLAREALRYGIPVCASITNYDNLVNMGYRGFMPNALGVWSESMASDAIRYHGIPAKKIHVTGPVQYDRYCKTPTISRESFLQKRSLDPKRKTVLFCGGINIVRYFEIFDLFCGSGKMLQSHQLNLVIRPYPHEKFYSSAAWKILETQLRNNPHVYVSDASRDNDISHLNRDLNWEGDADELHALLTYSDVMINIFSTVALESAICDLPTINLGYDSYSTGITYEALTDFQQRQTHNKRKERLAASVVAKDEKHLRESIEKFLVNRSLQSAERQAYARLECGSLDGNASHRLAAMVQRTIG